MIIGAKLGWIFGREILVKEEVGERTISEMVYILEA